MMRGADSREGGEGYARGVQSSITEESRRVSPKSLPYSQLSRHVTKSRRVDGVSPKEWQSWFSLPCLRLVHRHRHSNNFCQLKLFRLHIYWFFTFSSSPCTHHAIDRDQQHEIMEIGRQANFLIAMRPLTSVTNDRPKENAGITYNATRK